MHLWARYERKCERVWFYWHSPSLKSSLPLVVVHGQVEEAGLALAVIALMLLAEVFTEMRAKQARQQRALSMWASLFEIRPLFSLDLINQAIASLGTSAPQFARVLRDGTPMKIPRETVVPVS